jgi:hypothetical protein
MPPHRSTGLATVGTLDRTLNGCWVFPLRVGRCRWLEKAGRQLSDSSGHWWWNFGASWAGWPLQFARGHCLVTGGGLQPTQSGRSSNFKPDTQIGFLAAQLLIYGRRPLCLRPHHPLGENFLQYRARHLVQICRSRTATCRDGRPALPHTCPLIRSRVSRVQIQGSRPSIPVGCAALCSRSTPPTSPDWSASRSWQAGR